MTDIPDVLHAPGLASLHWSTDNVGEAAPGVLTPLSWSVWGPVGDGHAREVAYRIGALSREERLKPEAGTGVVEIFYGRIAMQLEYLATIGDRMPGTSGREAVQGLIGVAPDDLEYHPTRRRYPAIAWRLPRTFMSAPRHVRQMVSPTETWWRSEIGRLSTLDEREALELFELAVARFDQTLTTHSVCLLGVVQPVHQALSQLVERAGVGAVSELSGSGGAEMQIVSDIWDASRGRLPLSAIVARHGFHGPLEGELSSHVWRERPAPVELMVERYASRDEQQNPATRESEARRRLPELQREVLAALPRSQRPAARLVLNLAADRLPLRGVGKRCFLQAFDVARGAARQLGLCLAVRGELDDPEDVFYLTRPELATRPADIAAIIAARRATRERYESLDLPGHWTGRVDAAPRLRVATTRQGAILTGVGVSPGVAEGTVRVVDDPGETDFDPDEILVAKTTDPSWASVMFISAALVVDIGGMLSHAAVVARELGLPCVVNTRDGTTQLRTGDRVRVDGGTGTIEVLERSTVEHI